MGTEKRRINTQMPRRTKVRAATPMAAEWDISVGSPPKDLRTPANKMSPRNTKHHSVADPTSIPENPASNTEP